MCIIHPGAIPVHGYVDVDVYYILEIPTVLKVNILTVRLYSIVRSLRIMLYINFLPQGMFL